ncbi:hypothetical protein [Kitasatospora sp. CB02891]|uniref:hypothetical protein n=1 Tax=Kitasatospora sp. CB02891 TaxID=2020329 RepID=UPI0012FDA278|nr:hypothetical protein [Kitasatospora sp. CB02891]
MTDRQIACLAARLEGEGIPGGSVAISDVDGYPACGTSGPVPIRFGPVDPWVTAGPNATVGATMTFG